MEVVGVRERRIARNVSQQAAFQINAGPLSSPSTQQTVCLFPWETPEGQMAAVERMMVLPISMRAVNPLWAGRGTPSAINERKAATHKPASFFEPWGWHIFLGTEDLPVLPVPSPSGFLSLGDVSTEARAVLCRRVFLQESSFGSTGGQGIWGHLPQISPSDLWFNCDVTVSSFNSPLSGRHICYRMAFSVSPQISVLTSA